MATKTKTAPEKKTKPGATPAKPAKAKKPAEPELDIAWEEPKLIDGDESHRTVWHSNCGNYKVTRVVPKYDTGSRPRFVPYAKGADGKKFEPVLGWKDHGKNEPKSRQDFEEAFNDVEVFVQDRDKKPAVYTNAGHRLTEAGKINDPFGTPLCRLKPASVASATSQTADENGQPAKQKKERKQSNGQGRDPFGSKIGSGRADMNAAFTTAWQSMKDVCAAANCCSKPQHAESLRAKGWLERNSEGMWRLTEAGAKLMGKDAKPKAEEPKKKKGKK